MRILVTAGPTREHLDPVRFLSNPSTGKMGFAVAREAARRGHAVTLIAGPVALRTPRGVRRIDVTSAREMLQAVEAAVAAFGREPYAVVATAAVADWRPAQRAKTKIKKGKRQTAVLRLRRNPDILARLGRRTANPRPILVGFAAETNAVLAEAARKCRAKKLSFIVANDVTQPGAGFGTATNCVTFVFPDGTARPFPRLPKATVARRILTEIERLAK